MRRTTFDGSQDQRIADDASSDNRLMCSARNCQNLWSTSDGNLCRWHADAPPNRWPEVTEHMHGLITQRIIERDRPQDAPFVSAAEKRAILNKLRIVMTKPRDERLWLERLREKHRQGDSMSAMQKHCLAQIREAAEA